MGDKLCLVGSTSENLSSIAASQAEAEMRRLEEPLRDYLRIIQGVRLALSCRHERRVSYTALLQEIQTREVALHRLRMRERGEGVFDRNVPPFGRYESYDGGGNRHSIQEKQPPRDGILGKKKRMRDGYILERKREENGHPSWDVIILLMTT